MNTTINRQQWQEEEALRRFQLISPLLQTGLDDAKRIQLRKCIFRSKRTTCTVRLSQSHGG